MNRRSFVLSTAALPFLTLGVTGSSQGKYVCPPCGCAGDSLFWENPGTCSYCGMSLIALAERDGPDKANLPNGAASVSFPFQFLGNAIYLPVVVNGSGPHLFAMDTGSHTVFAAELTGAMGVKSAQQIELVLAKSVRRVRKQIDTVDMFDLWPLVGQKIYGDVGYDVLKPYVVEIDYAQRKITLHDPERYTYHGSGTSFPSTLWAQYDPQIAGEMIVPRQPPIPVRFTVDTGAGGTIVSSPLVKKYGLIEAVGKTLPVQDQRVGGYQPTLVIGRLSAFHIGPYVIDKPVVALSGETEGSLSSPTISVNLGNNILQRFKVIIDYPNNRLILEPNNSLQNRFTYDASGLRLAAKGSDFRNFVVQSVVDGSPAHDAGIQPGDTLTAINGTRAKTYALWQIEELLQKTGLAITLTLDRGGRKIERTIAPRELL